MNTAAKLTAAVAMIAMAVSPAWGDPVKKINCDKGQTLGKALKNANPGDTIRLSGTCVEAARAQGAGALRIMARHVLPHATWPLVAFATLFVARAILIEAALSFLGLGAQPPAASWGSMVASGRDYLRIAPHIALAPGVAIAITVLAFNLLGDGLRLAFDPQRSQL